MGEQHTESYGGWTITVWMYSIGTWHYIASNKKDMYNGSVSANNRVQAVIAVQSIIDEAVG